MDYNNNMEFCKRLEEERMKSVTIVADLYEDIETFCS